MARDNVLYARTEGPAIADPRMRSFESSFSVQIVIINGYSHISTISKARCTSAENESAALVITGSRKKKVGCMWVRSQMQPFIGYWACYKMHDVDAGQAFRYMVVAHGAATDTQDVLYGHPRRAGRISSVVFDFFEYAEQCYPETQDICDEAKERQEDKDQDVAT